MAILCLALLFKEEVGLIVAAFGLYGALAGRRPRLGAGLLTLGLGWTALVVYSADGFLWMRRQRAAAPRAALRPD